MFNRRGKSIFNSGLIVKPYGSALKKEILILR